MNKQTVTLLLVAVAMLAAGTGCADKQPKVEQPKVKQPKVIEFCGQALSENEDTVKCYDKIEPVDLTPLKNLKNLGWLELNNTQVSDLTPLKDIKNLERLYLIGTEVTEKKIIDLKKAIPALKVSW